MQLRGYQAADERGLRLLFEAAVLQCRPYSPEQRAVWAARAWSPELGVRLEQGRTLVAEEGGDLLGFATWAPGLLDLLYVAPLAQGRGVASALVRAVEESARGAGESELFTEASLAAAPRLEHLGWMSQGEQQVEVGGLRLPNTRLRRQL